MRKVIANPSSLKQSATIMSCQLADHQGSEIKYFCCSEDCMLPLCPECIQAHSEYHERKNKVAILKNFGDVRTLHHQRISNQITEIQHDVEQFDAFLNKDATRETDILQKIQNYKQSLIKSLNEVFSELERAFKLQILQDYGAKSERVDRITREIKIYVNQLKEYEAALESENCTKVIGKIHRRNFAKEYEEIKSRISKDEIQLDQYKLQIDESLTRQICDDLSRYISLAKIDELKAGKQNFSESRTNLKSGKPPRSGNENKLQSSIFEMVESSIQIKPDAFVRKSDSYLFEDVISQRVSRPTTSQSSNYPEYNCQPDPMIKEFFPIEEHQKPKQSVGGELMRTTFTKSLKGELDGIDAKSQSSITDEYGSDFEQTNEDELETVEENL